MLPAHHLMFSLPPAATVATSSFEGAAWFLAGSLLIDADHYIFSFERHGLIGPTEALRHHAELFARIKESPDDYHVICYFHTIEFLALVAGLAVFWQPALFLLGGLIFHIALDLYDGVVQGISGVRSYSLIAYTIRRIFSGKRTA